MGKEGAKVVAKTDRKGAATKRDGGGGDKAKPKDKGSKTKRSASAPKSRKSDEKGDKAAASGSAVDAVTDAPEEVVEEVAVGKKRRPKAETLKAITTGQCGVVEFVEDTGDEAPPAEAGGAAAAADDESGGAPSGSFSTLKWLSEVGDILSCLSKALCLDSEEGVALEDDAALGHIRALESRDELLERLQAGGALESIADAIWPKLEILKAGPASAAELADTWKADGADNLLYGGMPDFFAGLEVRIGSPDPKVLKDMTADHCSRSDSQVEFTTGNYNVVTTSEVEWKFVKEPETPLKWPLEERLMASEANRSQMRKLLPTEILQVRRTTHPTRAQPPTHVHARCLLSVLCLPPLSLSLPPVSRFSLDRPAAHFCPRGRPDPTRGVVSPSRSGAWMHTTSG